VPILTTLTTVFGQEKPTFGVAMVPSQAGGHIHIGDHVTLVINTGRAISRRLPGSVAPLHAWLMRGCLETKPYTRRS